MYCRSKRRSPNGERKLNAKMNINVREPGKMDPVIDRKSSLELCRYRCSEQRVTSADRWIWCWNKTTRQAEYAQHNIEASSRNHCCHKKKSTTYSLCASVALGTQRVKLFRLIILPSVTSPALQYFSTLSHKQYDFRGGGETLTTKYALIFYVTFVGNISHSKKNSARCYHKCK